MSEMQEKPHWERGHRIYGYWLGNQRLGWVGLPPSGTRAGRASYKSDKGSVMEELLTRLDFTLENMLARGDGESVHYRNLLAKRHAVAAGAEYQIVDVSEIAIKSAGRAFGKAAIGSSLNAAKKLGK